MLTHCGNNVRNRYSGCVFSVKDIVPVPLKTSRNPDYIHKALMLNSIEERPRISRMDTDKKNHPKHWQCFAKAMCRQNSKKKASSRRFARLYSRSFPQSQFPSVSIREIRGFSSSSRTFGCGFAVPGHPWSIQSPLRQASPWSFVTDVNVAPEI